MTDVIRQKIDHARLALTEGAPGADRGWRLALARAARDAMGLELEFQALTIARQSLAEIMEQTPDRALLALLHGPGGGIGVILLAPMVTATLIEMQTLGRLSARPGPARKASRIDAAMVAGVIDRALAGLDASLAEEADLAWAGGFRYAAYLEDARSLGLMLDEDSYRVLSADLMLGGGVREGRVTLILPAIGRGERPALTPDATEAAAPQFTAALKAQVLQADCQLDAVIGRLTLPIGKIMALRAGEVLDLAFAAVDAVSLETVEGRRIAGARLGQHRGMRALKLSETAAMHRADPVTPIRQNPAPVPEDTAPVDLRATG